jgi:hypothetical protein
VLHKHNGGDDWKGKQRIGETHEKAVDKAAKIALTMPMMVPMMALMSVTLSPNRSAERLPQTRAW